MSALALVFALALQSPAAAAPPPPAPTTGCRFGLIADLPVSFVRNRPMAPVEINGQTVRALIDTGADASLLFQKAAQRLGLPTRVLPDVRMRGVDGEAVLMSTHIDRFSLTGMTGHGFDIRVAPGGGGDVDMLIGEDLLSRSDVEFDLSHGRLRLLKPQGCADDQMAYWAKTYSEVPFTQQPSGAVRLTVKLNGAPVRAEFDSGASISVASEEAAARARVTLGAEAGRIVGLAGRGFARRTGVVAKVGVGDETVANAPLSFGPLYRADFAAPTGSRIAFATDVEMLLGADFLRSHHVLVSRSRQKLYFTYDGGPVFRLEPPAPSPRKETPAP